MKIELRSLVTLCDEVCLSYNRGATSTDLLNTAKVVLSCPDGLDVASLKDLGVEVFSVQTKEDSNCLSNIETCGLRLYHTIRKVYSEDFSEQLEVCKLRLLALRCIFLSFIAKTPNFKKFIEKQSSSGVDEDMPGDQIKRSIVEIMRGYIKTLNRVRVLHSKIESTSAQSQPIKLFEKLCLKFLEEISSPINGIRILRDLWGNNITGEEYAREFFKAAIYSTEIDIEELESNKINEFKPQSLYDRWINCDNILGSCQVLVQFEVTTTLRKIARNLSQHREDHLSTLKFIYQLNINIYRNIRKRGALCCSKEISNEADDLIELAKIFVQEKKESKVEGILHDIDIIIKQFKIKDEKTRIFDFTSLKLLIIRFAFQAVCSFESCETSQLFQEVIVYLDSFETEAAYNTAIDIFCFELFELSKKVNISTLLSTFFFPFIMRAEKACSETSNWKQAYRTCVGWKVQFFIEYTLKTGYTDESALWGQFLQHLSGVAEYISKQNFIHIVQTIIALSQEANKAGNYMQSKINMEFLVVEIEASQINDCGDLQELQARIKFSLATLLGTVILEGTINNKAKESLINSALLHLMDSRTLAMNLALNELVASSTMLHIMIYLEKTFQLEQKEPEAEYDFSMLLQLADDVQENSIFLMMLNQYQFYYDKVSAKSKYIEFLKILVHKLESSRNNSIRLLLMNRLELRTICLNNNRSFEDSVLSGKVLQNFATMDEDTKANTIILVLKLLTALCNTRIKDLDKIYQFFTNKTNPKKAAPTFCAELQHELQYFISISWNIAITVGTLENQYDIDYSEFEKVAETKIGNVHKMIIDCLQSSSQYCLILELLTCKCQEEPEETSSTVIHKKICLHSSRVILQTFKSIFSFTIHSILSFADKTQTYIPNKEKSQISDCLTIFESMYQKKDKYSCPRCSNQTDYPEISQIASGLKLLKYLMETDSLETLQQYDTATLAKQIVSKPNLNHDIVYQLGVICQIFHANEASNILFKCALQLEVLNEEKRYDQIARIIFSQLEIALSEQQQINLINQYFQILEKETDKSFKPSADVSDRMASLLWNIGVKQYQRGEQGFNEILMKTLKIFKSISACSKTLEQKTYSLENSYKCLLQNQEKLNILSNHVTNQLDAKKA